MSESRLYTKTAEQTVPKGLEHAPTLSCTKNLVICRPGTDPRVASHLVFVLLLVAATSSKSLRFRRFKSDRD